MRTSVHQIGTINVERERQWRSLSFCPADLCQAPLGHDIDLSSPYYAASPSASRLPSPTRNPPYPPARGAPTRLYPLLFRRQPHK